MKAELKHIEGVTWMAKSESNHWLIMDGPVEFGGHEAGVRPMEALLMGAAGCIGSDVASILKKKRAPLDKMEMEVHAPRAEEHPKVFKEITFHFIFYGDGLKEKDLERSISLSRERYCAATAMLSAAVPVQLSYKVISAEGEQETKKIS